MSKKDKDLYDELIALESGRGHNGPGLMDYDQRRSLNPLVDSDCEVLFTSKEIVEQKIQVEQGNGQHHTFRDGQVEERLTFKRMTTKRVHKYSDKEMEEIRQSCKTTYVHDYGMSDIYHMSDEEKAENDMLASVATKLSTVRATYTRVDQYVKAMRIVHEAWGVLADQNMIHSREEFFKLVAEGVIESNRIVIPKLRYINRYDKTTLAVYISNPHLDPDDLMPEQSVDPSDLFEGEPGYETEEDRMARILSPEEAEYIINAEDDPEIQESILVGNVKRKHYKNYENYDRTHRMSKYDKKVKVKGNKHDKFIHEKVSKLLLQVEKNTKTNSGYGSYAYTLTSSLFDTEQEKDDLWDDLYFDGDWSNDWEVKLYHLAIDEAMSGVSIGNYRTQGEKDLDDIMKTMEEDGMSVIDIRRRLNMTTDAEHFANNKARLKDNKRQEAVILDRLQKLHGNKKFKKIIKKAEDDVENAVREDILYS